MKQKMQIIVTAHYGCSGSVLNKRKDAPSQCEAGAEINHDLIQTSSAANIDVHNKSIVTSNCDHDPPA